VFRNYRPLAHSTSAIDLIAGFGQPRSSCAIVTMPTSGRQRVWMPRRRPAGFPPASTLASVATRPGGSVKGKEMNRADIKQSGWRRILAAGQPVRPLTAPAGRWFASEEDLPLKQLVAEWRGHQAEDAALPAAGCASKVAHCAQ
jgi:hypothetical protein